VWNHTNDAPRLRSYLLVYITQPFPALIYRQEMGAKTFLEPRVL
jgi:hypothetical protein